MPILDIFYSTPDAPDNYILQYPNLIIDTYSKDIASTSICKVEISAALANDLKNVRVVLKWERPPGGVTTEPIEIHDKVVPDIKTKATIVADDGSMVVTEPFANYRAKYLALEGYMDDHPLLGRTYARF